MYESIEEIIKDWANERLPREYDPLGTALADLIERINKYYDTYDQEYQ